MVKIKQRSLCLVALTLLVSSCGGGPTTPSGVSAVRIDPSSFMIRAGDTIRLVATAVDGNGDQVAASIFWSTSDSSIATVSATGLVEGVGVGSVSIEAAAGGVASSANGSVRPGPAVELVVTPSIYFDFVGDTTTLTGKASDALGNSVTEGITWSVDDASIVSVSSSGQAIAQAVGSTTIHASLDGTTAAVSVTVTPDPTNYQDLTFHFPFRSVVGDFVVAADIDQGFADVHMDHLDRTWRYFSTVFARTPGPYTEIYYTRDLNGLYARVFAFCPSVVIPGGRNLTTCFDFTDGVYIWFVVPFTEPDLGTQLHEISHTFLFFNYRGSEDFVWFKEGTGMYWESGVMDDQANLTVTEPLQYLETAFTRFHSEGALIPLEELVNMDRDTFYGHSEPTRVYGQAGMFIFYLMDNHPTLMDSLFAQINQGVVSNNEDLKNFLLDGTSLSWSQLEDSYIQHALSLFN